MVRVGHELHVCTAAYGVIKVLMAVIRRLTLERSNPALEWWSSGDDGNPEDLRHGWHPWHGQFLAGDA
jgi:hypothetical protein